MARIKLKIRETDMLNKRQGKILLVIIGISVLLRVAAAIYLGNQVVDLPGTNDQVSYHNLALRVLQGHGFSFGVGWWPFTAANAPTAHWSYLYTLYLVVVYTLFGPNPLAARLIQAVLVGILQPYLAYLVGRQVFSQVVGLVAAAITAIYAYFIYYAACLMTESYYIIAILASFYFAFRLVPLQVFSAGNTPESNSPPLKFAIFLGLSLGAAILFRQLFLLFIPFLFLWLLLAGRKQVVPLFVSGAIILLMILPATVFNYARFNRFVLVNTNAGFAFFWGNHPIYGTHFQPILTDETYQSLIPVELRGLDEAALDQALLQRGLRFIIDDPKRYLLLSISRIPSYFEFLPSPDSGMISNVSRVISFGLFLPFMLAGVVISFFQQPSPFKLRPPSRQLLLYLFMLIYTAIHVLTWTLVRYRLPVDAILIIFAGLALVELARRIPYLKVAVEAIA
jgi:4-amino-4-deoxy-L-arabinose transferase-like glycosyltransferase